MSVQRRSGTTRWARTVALLGGATALLLLLAYLLQWLSVLQIGYLTR